MKKVNYLILVLTALLYLNCSKDEAILENQNSTLETEELLEETSETSSSFSELSGLNNPTGLNASEKLPKKDDSSIRVSANGTNMKSRLGFGDGNGNIFDGTSGTNAEPNGGDLYIFIVDFAEGLTVEQKNMIRVPYQIQGDLVFFEQCPSNPDRELWHMNPDVYYGCNSSSISYSLPNCPNGRGDFPPKEDPINLRTVKYVPIPSCN
jgi:hypothetical protein